MIFWCQILQGEESAPSAKSLPLFKTNSSSVMSEHHPEEWHYARSTIHVCVKVVLRGIQNNIAYQSLHTGGQIQEPGHSKTS